MECELKIKNEPTSNTVSESKYSMSSGFAQRLAKMKCALCFSSYQSGILYFVGTTKGGGVNIHQTAMPKPMGLASDDNGVLLAVSDYNIIRFENTLSQSEEANGTFDCCYAPRQVFVTGRLDTHDVGTSENGDIFFVNTKYNCISRPSSKYSFEHYWRPNFISKLVREDRCHLNGMAMENGLPKYATAVSKSDTIDGWRDNTADGGLVIDIQNDRVVCEGLSMPHSPRVHNGTLWVANSGYGEIGRVDFNKNGKGKFTPVAFCPGFIRGISIVENFAFVGLSRPRYERFEGLELDNRLQQKDSVAWCGIQVIDLNSGACVDWFRIDGGISELYDVELLKGVTCPMAVPPVSKEAANLITFKKE